MLLLSKIFFFYIIDNILLKSRLKKIFSFWPSSKFGATKLLLLLLLSKPVNRLSKNRGGNRDKIVKIIIIVVTRVAVIVWRYKRAGWRP
jgi:hypothetical protein